MLKPLLAHPGRSGTHTSPQSWQALSFDSCTSSALELKRKISDVRESGNICPMLVRSTRRFFCSSGGPPDPVQRLPTCDFQHQLTLGDRLTQQSITFQTHRSCVITTHSHGIKFGNGRIKHVNKRKAFFASSHRESGFSARA